jgi:hypothetical protein
MLAAGRPSVKYDRSAMIVGPTEMTEAQVSPPTRAKVGSSSKVRASGPGQVRVGSWSGPCAGRVRAARSMRRVGVIGSTQQAVPSCTRAEPHRLALSETVGI